MNSKCPTRIILIIFTSILITNSVFASTIIQKSTSDSIEVETRPPRVLISDIQDGNGLTFTIINMAKEPIKDITVDIAISGGLFIYLPKEQYHIDILPQQSSRMISVNIFGIGLGQLTDYPTLTITISTPFSFPINQTLTLQVLGTKCTNLGEFFNTPLSYQGYTLFSPEYSKYTFLMDNNGNMVNEWVSGYIQGLPHYLDEKGCLIRGCSRINNIVFTSGGFTGRVEKWDWNNTLLWEFDYSTDQYCLHHDIEPLPNGNILMISWEYKTAQEAIEMGRNPTIIRDNELWPDKIIEVKPIGSSDYEIVWEWHVWDHLIQDFDESKPNFGQISAHPECINLNYGNPQADWTHINSIDYHPEFDQILLSVHNFNEIWVIDHSTTTEEAAGSTGGRYGKGGDLLYRWGNPQAYQQGSMEDQQFFGQHDAQWIPEEILGGGNILVFNNGQQRPDGLYSSIDEITPPVTNDGEYIINNEGFFGPNQLSWQYISNPPFLFYSGHISGAQRLPNGNTLICKGDEGVFFEVTSKGQTVWSYVNTFPDSFSNHVFKIRRYGLDYPGIQQIDQ